MEIRPVSGKTRHEARIPVSVTVSHESVLSLRQDEAINISSGGLFFKTDRPMPVGTMLYMSLEIAAGEPPLKAVGEVVWNRPVGGPDPAGVGVSFIQIEENERERLAKFLDGLKK